METTDRELWEIDGELYRLGRRTAELVARRQALLASRSAFTPYRVPGAPAVAPGAWGPPGAPRPAEASGPGVRNVLLGLGAGLLAVAAVAFTLLSWGQLGIGGRAAVLGAATGIVLTLPVPLIRRGLVATAEAVAAFGLVLLVLDAYALHEIVVPEEVGPAWYAAVLAVGWAGYGRLLPRLRGPLPVAVALAQLPLPLGAEGEYGLAWALLAVAAADAWFAMSARGSHAARAVAAAGGLGCGAWALVLGNALSAPELWLGGAVVAFWVALRRPEVSVPFGAAGGLALVAAAGDVVPTGDWRVLGYLLCSVPLWAARSRGLALAAGVVHGVVLAWAAPAVGYALLVPADADWPGDGEVVVALLVLAGSALLAERSGIRLPGTAVCLLAAAALTGPHALGWGATAVTPAAAALALALLGWALARTDAVAGGAALVCGASWALRLPEPWEVWGLLGVAAVGVALAARRGRTLSADLSRVLEAGGALVAALAVRTAMPDPGLLAAALAVCGAGTAGVALRPDRREAGYLAAGLLLMAGWVRLWAWGVTVPEAYTAPAAAVALVIGLLRLRADASVSSWAAYGPGLAVSLLPGLLALPGDPGWVRPLLLGLWALTATLAGARLRLRAPLLLGGAALALVAGNELAPYIVQLAGALPRWLVPALAGAALLAVGATYERRLGEARRLRSAWLRLG